MELENIPRWDDPDLKAGTKIRIALWLIGEVGEGNIFTKDQLRQAFPGVVQADRRLRDLRDDEWVIHTNREDVSLNSNEQRLAALGNAIWNPMARRFRQGNGVSAKERRTIFSEAGYQCELCGIAGGESYPEEPTMTATLSLTKISCRDTAIESKTCYLVECKRCRAGSRPADDVGALILEIGKLPDLDKNALVCLTRSRAPRTLFTIWAKYRHLSDSDKQAVLSHLGHLKTDA